MIECFSSVESCRYSCKFIAIEFLNLPDVKEMLIALIFFVTMISLIH